MTFDLLQEHYNQGFICIYNGEPINEVTESTLYSEYGTEYKKEEVDMNYVRVFEQVDELYLPSDMMEICKLLKNNIKQLDKFDRENGKKFTLLTQEGNILYSEEVNELFDISSYYDRCNSLNLMILQEVK